MGDPEKADASLIVDTRWLDDPAWRSLEGYTHYDTNYLPIADNLLDLAHLPYVHASTLGGSEDYANNLPKVETLERGIRVTRWALNTAVPAFVQKVKSYPGRVDRWNVYDFTVPGIFVMDSGMGPVGTGVAAGLPDAPMTTASGLEETILRIWPVTLVSVGENRSLATTRMPLISAYFATSL